MAALTTTSVVPAPVQTFYDRALLMRALPELVHDMVAQKRSIKRRSGDIIKFRRYERLGLALTPLQEGHPPSGTQLTYTDVTSQLKQYGDFIPLSDYVQLTIQDDILRETNKLLGEQSGQTLDALLRDVAVAGTNVQYGGGVANRGLLVTTTEKVTTAALDIAIRTMNRFNAHKYNKMISAGTKVSTFGIRDSYWAIIHPDVLFTLETLDGYKSVEEYGNGGTSVVKAEVGSYKHLRFLVSTQAKVFIGGGGTGTGAVIIDGTTGNADVYPILIFGREAIATVPIDGGNIQNIVQPLGSAGSADPLKQRVTSGWKVPGRTHVILNDDFMLRLEVTAGATAP